MFASIRRLLRSSKGEAEIVQPALEQLEPRLLLSADSFGTQPLLTLEIARQDQAVVVDLPGQNEQPELAPSAIFTLELMPSTDTVASPQGEGVNGGAVSPVQANSEEVPGSDQVGPVADSNPVEAGSRTMSTLPQSPVGSPEYNVEAVLSASTVSTQTEPVGPLVTGQQTEIVSNSEALPIAIRGPPDDGSSSASTSSDSSYTLESQSSGSTAGADVLSNSLLKAPDLPGLRLVDPDISNWQGQIIYLDFDGAQNVIYHGPVTVGPFDVPAFTLEGTPLAGQEQAVIDDVLSQLRQTFAGSSVIFATAKPSPDQAYSTIYVGGDNSMFAQYGLFLGLAEEVDVGNVNRRDEALVFADNIADRPTSDLEGMAGQVAATIAHECGHLLGLAHSQIAVADWLRFGPDVRILGPQGQFVTSPAFGMLMVGESLDSQIGEIADGLDETLGKIETLLQMSAELTAPLPLIGNKLNEAAKFIEDFRSNVHNALEGKTTADAVTSALETLFGSDHVQFDDTQTDTYEWTLDLEKSLALAASDLGFDIGLAGLDLTVETKIAFSLAWQFTFSFGVTGAAGFFFDASDEMLDVDFGVTTPGLNASGRLGFLELNVVDISAAPSNLEGGFTADITGGGADSRVTLAELDTLAVGPDLRDTTKAWVNLHLKASFEGTAVFPSLEADFTLDWQGIKNPDDASSLTVTFDNVHMDLGSFLSDMARRVFEQVQHVLAPLNSTLNSDLIGDKSLLEMLVDPIPGISYLLGDTNFLDLMELMGAKGAKAAETPIRAMIRVLDIYTFLESVMKGAKGSGIPIWFGEFTIAGDQLREKIDELKPTPEDKSWIVQLEGWDTSEPDVDAKDFLGGLKALPKDGGFSFPFLDKCTRLFSLMLGRTEDLTDGKSIDLFVYDLPELKFCGGYTQYFAFPPFPAVGLTLGGGLGVTLDLTFGFDTDGIKEYRKTSDPKDFLLHGFYVVDKYDGEQDIAEIEIEAKVELGVSAAKVVTIGGGLTGTLSLYLYDPDGNKKVSAAELVQNFDDGEKYFSDKYGSFVGPIMAPLGLFDFGGKIGVNLFVQIGPWKWYLPDPAVTLIDFSWKMPRPDPGYTAKDKPGDTIIPSEIAVDIAKLTEDAKNRQEAELKKSESDTWHFVSVSLSDVKTYVRHDGGVVGSESLSKGVAYNYVHVYDVREKRTDAFGRIGYGPWVRFTSEQFAGSYWADREYEKNHITVVGTDDVDRLYFIHGVTSQSEIDVKGAGDIVDLSDGTEGPATIVGGGGNDTITGGNKNDIISGGPGIDAIHGGPGDDMIGGDEDTDYLYGDDGVDEISGGSGDDWIYGGGNSDLLYGEDGNDWIYGQAGNDVLSGGIDDDHLFGGDDDDVAIGDAGTDIIEGGLGYDLIYGGAGSDTADGGPGADVILGGAGIDNLYGRDGNDILIGDDGLVDGTQILAYVNSDDGTDTIYGQEGEDKIFGGGGGDFLYGDKDGEPDNSLKRDIIFGDGGKISYSGDKFSFDSVTLITNKSETDGGADTIEGNEGDDVILAGAGGDASVQGNDGNDIVLGDNGQVTLSGGALRRVEGYGDGGIDFIQGGPNDDIILGGCQGDTIEGGLGKDILIGDAGVVEGTHVIAYVGDGDGWDKIYGQGGEDKIFGGGGNDYLYGFNKDSNDSGEQRDIIVGDGGAITCGSLFLFNDVTQITADSSAGGNDTIQGNEGNDVILAGAGGDPDVQGNNGNDLILGDNGTVTLLGGVVQTVQGTGDGGVDIIQGGAGNDIVMGGCQSDTIQGGLDNDILIGDAGVVDGTQVIAYVGSGDGSDKVYGQEGEDKILGGGGGDFLYGDKSATGPDSSPKRDIILGDYGRIVYAGDRFSFAAVTLVSNKGETAGGSDTIEGNAGDDILLGGAGNDPSLQGHEGQDVILGDSGEVTLSGGAVVKVVGTGAGGADTIRGQEGNDILLGCVGSDNLEGGPGDDILIGDAGSINGTQVIANVSSADGSDKLYGQGGEDKILGGGGGDYLYGDNNPNGSASTAPGRDILIGDGGRITYAGSQFAFDAVSCVETLDEAIGGVDRLYGNERSSVLVGGTGGDFLYGHNDPDIILGDNGTVVLLNGRAVSVDTRNEAQGGSDYVEACGADDVVVGGPNGSSDTIYGHQGNDLILGDNGRIDWNLDGSLSTLDLVQSAGDGVGGGDTLYGNDGCDIVIGGPGGDRIEGSGDPDILMGDDGYVNNMQREIAASVRSSDGEDHIYGEAGADKILGGGAGDLLYGDDNPDGSASLSPGREIIIGDGGRITYAGNPFAFDSTTFIETIDEAAGGNDRIYGNELSSILFGGTGKDFIYGHACTDWIVGDNGFAKFGQPGVLIELSSSDPQYGGSDTIDSGNDSDYVIGGSGNDAIAAGGTDQEDDTVLGDNGRITFGGSEDFDPGEDFSTLSFKFNSAVAPMAGVAGAPGARAGGWINLVDRIGTFGGQAGEVVRFDDGRIVGGVTIQWGLDPRSSDPDAIWPVYLDDHDEIEWSNDQDLRLFAGYLWTTPEHGLGTTIRGLASYFDSFDVYLYVDAESDRCDATRSVRCISDGSTQFYQNDVAGYNFTGTYTEVTSTDRLAPSAGNYVVFRDLTGNEVSLTVNSDSTLPEGEEGWSNEPTMAAIQIVGRHHPIDRIESTDPGYGGDDTISSGGGTDLVIGGSGNDDIITCGNPVYGRVDGDVVAGDNARATYMLGELREIRTTDSLLGGNDTIHSGNGADLVFGGSGTDRIDTGVYGPYDNGDIHAISFNFNGGIPEGMVTGVAGAVQVGNWNNLIGGGGMIFGDTANEPILFQDGRIAEGVTIEWGTRLADGRLVPAHPTTHTQIANPGTQNEQLFKGFLSACGAENVRINVTGLGILQGPYDIYVYVDEDGNLPWGDPSISDGTTTFYLNDPAGNTFHGEFVEVTSKSPANAQIGNYVVFRGLTADTVQISIGSGGSNYPTIAALQIVGGPDRTQVVRGGDYERDAVVGDNGAAYLLGDTLWEFKTLEPGVGGDDTIFTGEGTDLVLGGAGSDVLDGQEGHDVLLGDNGRFVLFDGRVIGLDFDKFTENWDDSVRPFGMAGIFLTNPAVCGDDRLAGGPGDDLLYGQWGNDTYVFAGQGLGRDGLVEIGDDGPAGLLNDPHDTLDFSAFGAPAQVRLYLEDPQVVNEQLVNGQINLVLILFDDTAFEDVIGSAFDDTIWGNDRDNTICGGPGNDVLSGGAGNDQISDGTGAPEVVVLGSGVSITNGATTPGTADGTDFGSVAQGGTMTRTYTIDNRGLTTLDLTGNPQITFTGSGDFSVAVPPEAAVVAGGTTTFQIQFHPSGAGVQVATVSIANNDRDANPYTFTIQGTGVASDLVTSSPSASATPVYRFWSKMAAHHFYTISESEKDKLITKFPVAWTYEGIAFYAFPKGDQTGTVPMYRFWSPRNGLHLFTIDKAEKDRVLATYPAGAWTYEGIAFYVYPAASHPANTSAAYRFRSGRTGMYFFTMSAVERDYVRAKYPSTTWTYENEVWYAFAQANVTALGQEPQALAIKKTAEKVAEPATQTVTYSAREQQIRVSSLLERLVWVIRRHTRLGARSLLLTRL